MTARSVRFHRWADAPNELRRVLDPGRRLALDWLAEVPAHRRAEAEGDFGWTDVRRGAHPDGGLLVAGRELASSPVSTFEAQPRGGQP